MVELRTIGSAIMSHAKKIRKEHPSKKWKDCVAKSGKDYRAGKLSVKPKKK